jgi:hypothetical protein
MHVNVISVGLAFVLIIIFNQKVYLDKFITIIFYFSSLQLLLFFSWIKDSQIISAEIGDIFSVLRPSLLLIIIIFFYVYLFPLTYEKLIIIKNTIVLQLIIIFVYVIFEVHLPAFAVISDFLYKRGKDVLAEAGISFFSITYYAGYIYYLFLLFLGSFLLHGIISKEKGLFLVLFSLLLIFYSNSKTYYFLGIISIPMLLIFKNGVKYVFYLFLLSVGVLSILFLFLDDSILYLLYNFNKTTKSAMIIISNPYSAYSFMERWRQINDAFTGSFQNYGFGLGLGKGLELESWLANFCYRYGLIGLFLYIILFIYLYILSRKLYILTNDNLEKSFLAAIGIWAFTLPISLLSGPMIEISKMAVFSAFMIAILFSLQYKIKMDVTK